ncbi:MAG: hypothetical protein JSV04_12855 [Candidatus Heimdallarchaeota archaeon]|nr:MAG: hypothetical protein JSV04_12855 [Candidatus Heimdallarchaeota archaeon]
MIDLVRSWDPLVLFQQGLRNSAKVVSDLEPVGLSACLKMAKYCLKVSPGFLSSNRFEKITIARMSDSIYQLTIPLDFSKGQFTSENAITKFCYLTVQADSHSPPNLKFNLLTNNPEYMSNSIPLMAISPLNSPLKELIEKTMRYFNLKMRVE